ncbi:MAG: M43 family zinc metalloprotease, partial [Bacteroidota bacterium]
MEQLFLHDPAQRQAFLDHKAAIAEIAHNGSAQSRKMDDLIIVPVVVHVMYNDCENNISNAQVVDAMRVLNEDFRRRNADASDTRDIFKDLAEDVNMEFRLARIDPDGNPTTGINHVETPLSVNANNSIKSISRWPSDQYLNIWLVESIDAGAGSGNGIILGYAQFPNFGSWSTYGVVMRNDRFGTIGTANGNDRTYTHEVGHCLGLLHTFQSGCGTSCGSSGDFICDTPPVEDPTWSCSNTQNTCTNDQVGTDSPFTSNVFDMIENYMSYDDCQNMFTTIQAASMRATIENTPRLTALVSEANLI